MVVGKDEPVRSFISSSLGNICEVIYAVSTKEVMVYLKYLPMPHLILLNADISEIELNDFLAEQNDRTGVSHMPVVMTYNAGYEQSMSGLQYHTVLKYITNPLVVEELITEMSSGILN